MNSLKPHIFYLTNDPERALGLETFLARYSIICIDNHPMVPILRARGVSIFSLGENSSNPNPTFRSTQRLLESDAVLSFIKNSLKENEEPYIMTFKPSPRIEALAKANGLKMANPEARLNRLFENKVSQYNMLKGAVKNFPKTVTGKLGDFEYDNLTKEISQNLVLQFNRGHTGDSTFFINSEDDFIKLKELFPLRLCRISQFIEGEAWTLNACTTKYGTAVHGLSYQITGIKELTNLSGATVGNDWNKSSQLTKEIKDDILMISKNAGDLMYTHGFKGLFGLDFIVAPNGEVYLIEINARQPASTSTHAKLMLEKDLPPLQLLHLNEFLTTKLRPKGMTPWKALDKEVVEDTNQSFFEPINASQVVIRSKSAERMRAEINQKIGIYRGDKFLRDEYAISGIHEVDEVLFLRIAEGQLVAPNGEIARVQARTSLTENRHLFEPFVKLLSND